MSIAFHHAALIVADLDKSACIYGDILGLQPDFRPDLNFEGLFYKLGNGQQLHLMKLDNPDVNSIQPEHGGRYRHIALAVVDLAHITQQLKQANINFTMSKSGRKAAFFYDYDGNAIELIEMRA